MFTVVTKEGYAGEIEFTVGINTEGTITGVSFLTIKETAGLGMKAKDDEFKSQYVDKNVESFVYTKSELRRTMK